MRRVARYSDAIRWVIENDDTEWLSDDAPIISVSASLIADIFARSDEEVIYDLRMAMRRSRSST